MGIEYTKPPKLEGKGIANRETTTDHARGRTIIGRGNVAPILVQRDVTITHEGVVPGPSTVLESNAAAGVAKAEPAPPAPMPAQNTQQTPDLSRMNAIAAGVSQPQTQPLQARELRKLTQVKFSGLGMGRLVLFCREAVVSEGLIVLGFPQDGQTAIVIPPKAEPGEEMAPITVTVGGVDYLCVSNEWTFELNELLFLVLVRL